MATEAVIDVRLSAPDDTDDSDGDTTQRGTIDVRVSTPGGNPATGATVTVSDPDGAYEESATPGAMAGKVKFADVLVQDYVVRITHPQYADEQIDVPASAFGGDEIVRGY